MAIMDDLVMLMDGEAEMGGIDTLDVPTVKVEISR